MSIVQSGLSSLSQKSLRQPRPLRSLIFTIVWESFSAYGIAAIMLFFLIAPTSHGGIGLSSTTATALMSLKFSLGYIVYILGSWLADNYLGQKRAVWYGSILMVCGHFCIACSAFGGNSFFFFGLVLISLGGGLYVPSLSLLTGILYREGDVRRVSGFALFYMGVNLGAFIAPFLTGLFGEAQYWHIGFGIGGLGMLAAGFIFRFITMPSLEKYAREEGIDPDLWDKPAQYKPYAIWVLATFLLLVMVFTFLFLQGILVVDAELLARSVTIILTGIILLAFIYYIFFKGLTQIEQKNMLVCLVFFFVAVVFWSAFQQQTSSYALFAKYYLQRDVAGFTIPAGWLQSVNPICIILFSPLIASFWLFLARRHYNFSHVMKLVVALLLAALAMIVMVFASYWVQWSDGNKVTLAWPVFSLFLMTCGELFISPVGLAAITGLAPHSIRTQTMTLWYGASSVGTAVANLLGAKVKSDSLETLPHVFVLSASWLLGAVFVLLCGLWVIKLYRYFNARPNPLNI